MTPDDAIALVQKYDKTLNLHYSTWQDAACVLAGEVEQARKTAQFHKDNHLESEEVIEVLRQRVVELKSSLKAAANYIDVLGGVSKQYRYQANQIEGGE